MTRSVMREHTLTILCRAEFYDAQEMTQQINYYLEEVPKVTEKEVNEITGKVLNIVDKIPEIDEMINSVSKSWPTSRLGKSELTIMRLAVYEIKFDEDIPTNVLTKLLNLQRNTVLTMHLHLSMVCLHSWQTD